MKQLYICAWKTGSTNGHTMKPELPLRCQVVGCPAQFEKLPPMLEGQALDCFTFKNGLTWGDVKNDKATLYIRPTPSQ